MEKWKKDLDAMFQKIRNSKKKRKPIQTIEATKFVKTQIGGRIVDLLPEIIDDATAILNLYPKDCPKGIYPFSRIIPLHNKPYNQLECRIVKITSKNEKYLKTDYVARTKDEIPYLKRWFPKGSPVKGIKSHHVDVILYNKEQLNKEGIPIDSDWGIVCINVELEKSSLISPTTMINNHMGLKFGGNGQCLNVKEYLKTVEFWKYHALLEK